MLNYSLNPLSYIAKSWKKSIEPVCKLNDLECQLISHFIGISLGQFLSRFDFKSPEIR